MKLKTFGLISIFGAVLSASKTCNAPPDLEKGQWNCTNENSWNQGDICTISNDGCSGSVKCSKGNWKGKYTRFCPKDCEGKPKDPGFGGNFECENNSCKLTPWDGFKCRVR